MWVDKKMSGLNKNNIFIKQDKVAFLSGNEEPKKQAPITIKARRSEMTTKINAPIVKGVTEKHDEIIPISKIKFDKDNRDLYRDNDEDYFNSLV